jgi:hypothetical protein
MPSLARRRAAIAASSVLLVGLPLGAFLMAPAEAQLGTSPIPSLAGYSSSAVATAIQLQPLTPGLVGAGNVSLGNLIQASIPYASSDSTTGPSSSGTASPVYPGPTASQLGTVFNTFSPLPPAFVTLLNDPVLAQSTYPPQVKVGSSGKYSPPLAGLVGVGTAQTSSNASGSTATAAVSDTSLLGSGSAPGLLGMLGNLSGPLLEVATSTASTRSIVGTSAITATAHTEVGKISLLFGLIQIAGITSDASASSNGTTGNQTNALKIGSVTVAGHAASIGPNGIQIDKASQGNGLVGILNQVLILLNQVGLSVNTIAPTEQLQGNSATVTSGALHIAFVDPNVPNPNGLVPIHSIGLDLDLGLTQASASATVPPTFPTTPLSTLQSVPTSTGLSTPGSSGSGPSFVPGTPGQVQTIPGTPGTPGSGAGSSASTNNGSGSNGSSQGAATPIGFLGLPIKLSWVVLAFVLALVGSGPLLAYANWQLLRGRSP